MAKITRDIIEEVKKHVSILDLASEYFELTRKRGYLGIKNVSGDSDYSLVLRQEKVPVKLKYFI